MMTRLLSVIALLTLGRTAATAAAQQTNVLEAEATQEIRLQYLLFRPTKYEEDPQRCWPFILYLHGGSARGDDIERLRKIGLPKRLEQDPDFPFIVASPLLPEGEIWTDVHALMALVDQVAREHRVNAARIYVTGHSMGGRGALYLAYRQPDRFAAVVAISPYSPITAWAKRLTNVPLWLIHGAKDVQAPIKDTEELVQAIEKAGGRPRFTSLPDRDHFLLDSYDRNDIFDWLLEHRKPEAP
ncbi:MAG TPA: alpha/beta fold hydrolase [Chthoniobacterales bacterium]|nr:alpha/beta fold hydrolase [Chthoniobacterales bacterium]